jgi:hypothetical protein
VRRPVQMGSSRRQALLVAIIAAFGLAQLFTGGLLTLATASQGVRNEMDRPSNSSHKSFRVSRAGYSKKGTVPSIPQIPGEYSGLDQIKRLEPKAHVPMTALPNLPMKNSAPKIVDAPDKVDLTAAFKKRAGASRGRTS